MEPPPSTPGAPPIAGHRPTAKGAVKPPPSTPEAPPITSTDLSSRLAWLGVLGGPLVLLVAALTWSRLPTLMVIGALVAFVGGFVTLVMRLPRDRDGGPDDGAVV